MKIVTFHNWDCYLSFKKYDNGNLAIQLLDARDHGPVATATVNMPQYNCPRGHVYVKDYSENKGMLKALVDAGVVEDTGIRVDSGHVTVPLCRMLITEEDL